MESAWQVMKHVKIKHQFAQQMNCVKMDLALLVSMLMDVLQKLLFWYDYNIICVFVIIILIINNVT